MKGRQKAGSKYRYSIIPADAITDPALTPRDLQVLCLLGRHVDEYGWCWRSQVVMARELNCDRRTVQRALERLVEAGYLAMKAQGRGKAPAPDTSAGEQPFAPYAYRVLLDLDGRGGDAQGGAQKCAGVDEVRKNAQGGAHSGAQGGAHSGSAPLKEHTPKEHTPHEQSRAREVEASPSKEEGTAKRPKRYSDAFDRFKIELRNWPGYDPNWIGPAWAAWQELDEAKELRPPGDMVAAARTEGRRRHAVDASRKVERKPAQWGTHPRTWLLRKCFVDILDEPPLPPVGPAAAAKTFEELVEGARVIIAAADVDALRRTAMSDADIASWFVDAEFLHDELMVRAGTEAKATRIRERFLRNVAQVFGVSQDSVRVEARSRGRAA